MPQFPFDTYYAALQRADEKKKEAEFPVAKALGSGLYTGAVEGIKRRQSQTEQAGELIKERLKNVDIQDSNGNTLSISEQMKVIDLISRGQYDRIAPNIKFTKKTEATYEYDEQGKAKLIGNFPVGSKVNRAFKETVPKKEDEWILYTDKSFRQVAKNPFTGEIKKNVPTGVSYKTQNIESIYGNERTSTEASMLEKTNVMINAIKNLKNTIVDEDGNFKMFTVAGAKLPISWGESILVKSDLSALVSSVKYILTGMAATTGEVKDAENAYGVSVFDTTETALYKLNRANDFANNIRFYMLPESGKIVGKILYDGREIDVRDYIQIEKGNTEEFMQKSKNTQTGTEEIINFDDIKDDDEANRIYEKLPKGTPYMNKGIKKWK